MTTPTTGQQPDDPKDLLNLIAAQYVLGTLSNSARLRFQTLMQQQPALRQLTHAWERRLNPLANLLEPQDVPAHVWQQIEAKLDILNQLSGNHNAMSQPENAGVVDTSTTDTSLANTNPASAKPLNTPIDNSKNTAKSEGQNQAANDSFWQPWAWVSTAIAASLALFIAFKPQPLPITQPPVVVQTQPAPSRDIAVLSDDSKQPAWIVRQQGNALLLSQINNYQVPTDRDLELWSIQGNAAPQSLGVIRIQQGKAILSVAQTRLLAADAILAISLEPKNGSPTGQPTGSVLYTGKVV